MLITAQREAMRRSGELARLVVAASIGPRALQIARQKAMERSALIARQIVRGSMLPWHKP